MELYLFCNDIGRDCGFLHIRTEMLLRIASRVPTCRFLHVVSKYSDKLTVHCDVLDVMF